MHGAVQQVRDAECLTAGNRDTAARCHAAAARRACVGGGAAKRDERCGIAAFEWQRLDPLVFDDLPDRGISRFDQRRLSLDRQCLIQLAELKRHVDDRVAVDLQDGSSLRVGAEAGERGLEAIRAERKIQEPVRTLLVGHDLAPEACVSLYGQNSDARQHRAAAVGHRPVDLRGSLRPRSRCREHEKDHADQGSPGAIHSKSLLQRRVHEHAGKWMMTRTNAG